MTRMLSTLLCASFLFFSTIDSFAIGFSPVVQTKAPATPEQKSRMTGMIAGAIQEFYGGNPNGGRERFERILSELEKIDYSADVRWSVYFEYARALLEFGEYRESGKYLDLAMAETGKLPKVSVGETYRLRGQLYVALKRFDDAVAAYKEALKVSPGDSEAALNLGSVYRLSGQFESAREVYEKLISEDPKNWKAFANLGNVYMAQGKLEQAVAQYEKCAEFSPDRDIAARNFLIVGFQYLQNRQVEKAMPLFQKALEIAPNYPLAHADFGYALLAQGKKAEAIAEFEKALKLKPEGKVKQYIEQGLKAAKQ